MEETFDYHNEIQIDLDNLHEEWRTHAQKRKKYADAISDIDRKVKQAKKLLDVTESKLTKEANQDPQKYLGVPKATVALVGAYCKEHKEYDKISDDLIQIEYDLSMAKNAVMAFDNRKSALENEVKLWLGNYFASPTEERMIDTGKSIHEENREKTESTQREKLNQRRKRT
jgi:hypothetical protein